jgi:hypothetical protein
MDSWLFPPRSQLLLRSIGEHQRHWFTTQWLLMALFHNPACLSSCWPHTNNLSASLCPLSRWLPELAMATGIFLWKYRWAFWPKLSWPKSSRLDMPFYQRIRHIRCGKPCVKCTRPRGTWYGRWQIRCSYTCHKSWSQFYRLCETNNGSNCPIGNRLLISTRIGLQDIFHGLKICR